MQKDAMNTEDKMRTDNETWLEGLLDDIELTLGCTERLENLIESNNQEGFNYFTSCCHWANRVIRYIQSDANHFHRPDKDINAIKNAILQISKRRFELKPSFPSVNETTFGEICEKVGPKEDDIRDLYIKHIANSHDIPVVSRKWYSWTEGKYADFPVKITPDGATFVNGKYFLDCLKQLIGVWQQVVAYLQSLS